MLRKGREVNSMKRYFLIHFAFIAIFGATVAAAQTPAEIQVKIGSEKRESRSRITVRFVSVVEDSRCPVGVDCVWAGNAQIRVKVRRGAGSWKTVKLNTGKGEQTVRISGYEIRLKSLTPAPHAEKPLDKAKYSATLEIRK